MASPQTWTFLESECSSFLFWYGACYGERRKKSCGSCSNRGCCCENCGSSWRSCTGSRSSLMWSHHVSTRPTESTRSCSSWSGAQSSTRYLWTTCCPSTAPNCTCSRNSSISSASCWCATQNRCPFFIGWTYRRCRCNNGCSFSSRSFLWSYAARRTCR